MQTEIDTLFSRINVLQTNITTVYESLSPEDKIGVGTSHDKIIKRFNEVRTQIKNLEPEQEIDNPLPLPRKPNQANIRKKNLSRLNDFMKKPSPSITKNILEAVRIIFGEEFLARVNGTKKPKDKVEMIKTEYAIYKSNNRPIMVDMGGGDGGGGGGDLPDAPVNDGVGIVF